MGCGRLRKIEDDDVVFILCLGEEGSAITVENMNALIAQNISFDFRKKLKGKSYDFRVKLDIINLNPRIFQNLLQGSASSTSDQKHISCLRILEKGKVHRFLGCSELRIRIDEKGIAVERYLLFSLYNLELSVNGIFAPHQVKRPPVNLLAGKIKKAEAGKEEEDEKE